MSNEPAARRLSQPERAAKVEQPINELRRRRTELAAGELRLRGRSNWRVTELRSRCVVLGKPTTPRPNSTKSWPAFTCEQPTPINALPFEEMTGRPRTCRRGPTAIGRLPTTAIHGASTTRRKPRAKRFLLRHDNSQRFSGLAVPGTQVADSDPDDLRRPAWTQRRVVGGELAHHVLSTEASIHEATDIYALVQRHLAATAVPQTDRADVCQERAPTAPRARARRGPLRAYRCRSRDRLRGGPQRQGCQNCQADYPQLLCATGRQRHLPPLEYWWPADIKVERDLLF
jgi:hypothetical protein